MTARLEAGPRIFGHVFDAFALLPDCLERPAWTVHAWDGPPPSPAPWDWSAVGHRHRRLLLNDPEVEVFYHSDPPIFSLVDRTHKRVLCWSPDGVALPFWERAQPLLHPLQWLLAEEGTDLVHGAALARGNRGVLLVGASGSGKSTTALLAAADGWSYLADDFCAVQAAAPTRVLSLFATAKVAWDRLHWLERLEAAAVPQPREDEKAS